jgi:hypothetical protein
VAAIAFQLIMILAKNLGELINIFRGLPDATPDQIKMIEEMAPAVNKAVDDFLAYKPKQV